MANKTTREREIAAAKVKVYNKKKSKLVVWSPIALALIVVTALLMFVPFIDIMNDPSRVGGEGERLVEIGANGYECLLSGLTGDFTSANAGLAPFYYCVNDQGGQPYVNVLAISTLVAAITAVIAFAVQIAVIATGKDELVLISGLCEFICGAAFIIAFVGALGCQEKMIEGYCSGNQACYIRSFALLPAVSALAALALDGVHFYNHLSVKALAR